MAYLVISPYGAVSGAGLIVVVALGLGYCAIARTMARLGTSLTTLRLAVAILEMAFVASQADRPAHFAYIPAGIILALDVGLRHGWRALWIPLLVAGLPWLVVSDDGRSVISAGTASIVLGASLGIGIRIACRRRDDALDRRTARLNSAEINAAGLAGRNAVVMRGGETSDLVQRAGVLLELGGGRTSVRRRVAAAKAGLADETRRGAAYLGDVLTAWQRRYHLGQADLTRTVTFELVPDHRLVVLTSRQADTVVRHLDAEPPFGSVAVEVEGVDAHRIDLPRTVVIGDRRIVIPVEIEPNSAIRSPFPAVVAMIGLWMVAPISMGAARSSPALWVMAATTVGLASVTGRLMQRVDRSLRIVYPGLAIWVLSYCLVVAPLATSDPVPQLPASGVVEYLVFLTMLALPAFPRAWRAGPWGVVAVSMTLLVLPGLGESSLRHLAAESLGPLLMGILVFDAGNRLLRYSSDRTHQSERERQRLAAAAYREGRRGSLEELAQSIAELRRDLETSRSRLDTEIAAEVGRRLDTAERSLADA